MADFVKEREIDYREHSALNQSTFKDFLKDPYVFMAGVEKERTSAMDFGTLCHDMILSIGDVESKYHFAKEKLDFRKKEHKELKAKVEAENKILVSQDDWLRAEALKMQNSDIITTLFADPQNRAELSVYGKLFEVDCKGRCDYVNENQGVVYDLKITNNSSPTEFKKRFISFRYDIQAAWYLMLTGLERFVILAISAEAPYMSAIYEIDSETIKNATAQIERGIEMWQNKTKYQSQLYRDFNGDDIITLTMPDFVYNSIF